MAVTNLLRRMTRLDKFLAVGLTLLVLLSSWLLFGRQPGARLLVDSEGQTVFSAPLSDARQFTIDGPLGATRLQVANGGVRVLSSPCPQKICIGLGEARRAGDLLACVPNRIVVRIVGPAADETGYDLLSR